MRVGDRCQAHRCAGGGVGSTRITETGLAARNRRAGFPAPLGFADQADEARLRSTWPAPDGRGRPAPPRRGRAACVRPTYGRIPALLVMSAGRAGRHGGAISQPTRDAASALRQFEKCVAGAAGRGGAVSPLTFESPVRPTDWAPACAQPPAAAGIVSRTPETHFSARRPGAPAARICAVGWRSRRGGCDVASPHQTRDPSLPAAGTPDSFTGSKAGSHAAAHAPAGILCAPGEARV